jgi:hypothetical protein
MADQAQTFTADDVERARIGGVLEMFTLARQWGRFLDILNDQDDALEKLEESTSSPTRRSSWR